MSNKKKDLLIMCQYFYPEQITSARLPFMTAKYLAKEGLTVEVLTGTPSNYLEHADKQAPKTEVIEGVRIRCLSYLTLSKKNIISRLVNYFSIVIAFLLKLKVMKNYKVIMVYSNPPILPIVAVLAKKFFNTKLVFVSYDVYPEIAIKTKVLSERSLLTVAMKLVNKCVFRSADKVVALSGEMKKFLVENRNIDSDKIEIIPNWSTETKPILKPTKESSDGIFRIGYFGNIGIAQDFDTIKNAILSQKNNSSLEWIFAGHGTFYDSFKQFIIENKITNVRLYGYLDEQKLNKVANSCDSFLLSLKKELNGLAVPSKYYTYLNYGKPIIAIISKESDINKEIVKYKTGRGIGESNTEELCLAIEKVGKYRSQFKDYSQVYKNNFSPNIQLKKYVALIKKVLNKESI
ncbi:capsular polysaccharide biosynthesis protein Cps4F [Streptococcus porcinus]|uniref:glycosyltransferase family 4 protein n=1 Tax=Streptococcus porcinus TaxID=1340 RepID=UPI0010CAD1E9|nr:glycosyltransferase family 4 protein [Streptococcus porcinus]VTS24272.1 capsular polysaccharide biosynthesis protein Cps4F [Streptococcus porcinus]